MSKCKSESRSRQQDQLELTISYLCRRRQNQLRSLFYKITNHFTQTPTIGLKDHKLCDFISKYHLRNLLKNLLIIK